MASKNSSGLTDRYWVTDLNYREEVTKSLHYPSEVHIHDVTLREAEQSPNVVLLPHEKMRIFEALDEMGVYSIELLPLISKEDRELAFELTKRKHNAKVMFLCRWVEKEVEFAAEAKADGVVIECPGYPWMGKLVWDLDENQMVERLTRVVKYAKSLGLYVVAMPWDDLKAPLSFMERMYKSIVFEGGVDHVTIADTFGVSLPWTTIHVMEMLKKWIPGTPIEWHCHNDYGLATAEMLSAVAAGATTVHTSINTLGERAGNASTEEVAVCLEILMKINTGLKLDRLYPVSQLVAQLSKIPLPANKPVTGENEFTYSSGMVIDMVLRAQKSDRPFATMPFSPEVIGRKGYKTLLGKGTGGTVVRDRLGKLGLSATKEQTAMIVESVKQEAQIRKWSLPEDAFEDIARKILELNNTDKV